MFRRLVAEAETMLRELDVLLAAEQRRLLTAFQERQQQFVDGEHAAARRELEAWIDGLASARLRDRSKASSGRLTSRGSTPRAGSRGSSRRPTTYRDATARFTALANSFLARLAESHEAAFESLPRSLEPEIGLREGRHFYATNLMHLTAPGFLTRAADLLLPRRARVLRISETRVRIWRSCCAATRRAWCSISSAVSRSAGSGSNRSFDSCSSKSRTLPSARSSGHGPAVRPARPP